jgi:hypothetical protein
MFSTESFVDSCACRTGWVSKVSLIGFFYDQSVFLLQLHP